MSDYCPSCGEKLGTPEILTWGGWELDQENSTINKIKLSPTQTRLMTMLVSRKGAHVSNERLKAACYGVMDSKAQMESQVIRQHLCHIRAKVKSIGGKIKNDNGVGYYLVKRPGYA